MQSSDGNGSAAAYRLLSHWLRALVWQSPRPQHLHSSERVACNLFRVHRQLLARAQ